MPRSLDDEPRRDSLPLLPSHNSQPDLNGQLRAKSPLGFKRASTMSPGLLPPTRHTSLPPSPAPGNLKKRPTTIGAASSHGRFFKVLADFFLLAGRLEEASIWLVPTATICVLPSRVLCGGITNPLCGAKLRRMLLGMRVLWRVSRLSL